MKKLLTTLFIFSLSLACSRADSLPFLDVKDWTGYHATSKGKYHGIGVGPDGALHLFFMQRGAKINVRTPVELELLIERKSKEGTRWIKKKVNKEAFIKPGKVTEDVEQLSLHGMITGDVEFKIDFEFMDDGVLMKADFVGKPADLDKADYRLSLVSDIESISTVSKEDANDEKKIKSKTRGHELRIETRKGKPTKVRFYEPMDTETLEQEEIVSIELRSDKIGRKKLFWSLADPKQGSLRIEPDADNKMPFEGFKVFALLVDETGKKLGDGILLEYK